MKAPTRKDKGRKLLAGPQTTLLTGCQEEHLKHFHEPKLVSIEEIRHRAEVMTPCLKMILDFRPSPCWNH